MVRLRSCITTTVAPPLPSPGISPPCGCWASASTHALLTGHFCRDYLPVGPKSFFRDFLAAATFKLEHRLGEYNAVQKAFYLGVLGAVVMMIISGLAIWKPVQLQFLTALFGGFQGARLVHFLFMAAIALFIVVHVTLVALVPKTFVAMVTGRATARPHHAAAKGSV
jgi:thiosulfate reductase cytochrome b subunit